MTTSRAKTLNIRKLSKGSSKLGKPNVDVFHFLAVALLSFSLVLVLGVLMQHTLVTPRSLVSLYN